MAKLILMKWPWQHSAQREVETLRWAELGANGLRFGGLEAPDVLLEQLAGVSGGRISRREALKSTAVLRARNLIAGTLGSLPIELRDAKRNLDERNWLALQPNPVLENTVHFACTFEDLLFEAKSYWRVTAVGSDGYPLEAEHLDIRSVSEGVGTFSAPSSVVSEDLAFVAGDPIWVDGRLTVLTDPRRPVRPGQVIRFVSPNPPLLAHCAKAIRTLLLLDSIAADYANDPLPFGYFQDALDEEPLSDNEVEEHLRKWHRARKQRRWGYVERGLELNMLQWPTPQQLQLVEARNHAVLDIARATGLDPLDLATAVEGTSHTYENAEQRRLDLIDFTYAPYMSGVQDRLSMNDIVPPGIKARYDLSEFTRADTKSRMEGYKIGIEAGVLKPNDGRRKEVMPDLPEAENKAPVRGAARVSPNGNGNGRQPSEVE